MSHLLVIGGTSGIGEEVVRQSKDQFDRVTVPDKYEMDVRSSAKVERFIRGPIGEPITHTVYSAGLASLQMIPDLMNGSLDSEGMCFDEYQNVYDVNVFGFMRVLSALSRSFAGGRVVAIVSDASKTPMRGSMAYCSSKAALAMAVRCAARELGKNWNVNGVSPSAVDGTPMTDWIDETVPEFRGWTKEEARSYELASIPKGRRAMKEEVAEIVLSTLTGPDFLTGSIIELTGGK